jgi:glycosyltransferase involved in cell wall biosynthesis
MNAASDKRPKLTIGILAMNEERRIADCLRSAEFADQVIVIDSGSQDRTTEIASSLGAEVHEYRDWQGFAVQRNRLLTHVQGDYVFFLDADEIIPPALAQEIRAAADSNEDAMWEIRWCEVAFGRELKHMKSTGGVKRMFRRSSLSGFQGLVHETPELTDPGIKTLSFDTRVLHYSRTSVYDCLKKLAQYVQLGAAKRAQLGKRGGVVRGLGSGLTSFLKLYIFGRGFLYGAEGFLFCLFVSLECFFRYVALSYDTEFFDRTTSRG